MRYRIIVSIILFTLAFGILLVPTPVLAFEPDRPIDLVIVIDNSGSMEADRRNLRFVAAKMMIDLLSERDRVGLVLFSSKAQQLTSQLVPLNLSDSREELKRYLSQAPKGGTNYDDALRSAYELFGERSGNQRAVIFLTDGEPDPYSDAQLQRLETFEREDIPVFLIMLEYRRVSETILDRVDSAFSDTGPAPRYVDSHNEIARAFAAVLTELRPNYYLDVLDGIPETASLLRFEAQVSSEQRISEVDFVFVTLQDAGNFEVSVRNTPAGIAEQMFSEARYNIVSYDSSGSQPVDGKWVFAVNGLQPDSVEAFALIRSDIRLELTYPSGSLGQREMVSNQILPIGVTVQGAAVESTQLEANVRIGTQCEIIDRVPGQAFPLRNIGLSPNHTVFWTKIAGMSNQDLVVSIEFKQLDLPLRLARCFAIRSIAASDQVLKIVQPTDSDLLEQDKIPLRITLPPTLEWLQVTAFVESPTGRVASYSLTGGPKSVYTGTASVDVAGQHTIRFVAEGNNPRGNAFTLFEETIYDVEGSLTPVDSVDLGPQTYLGQVLEGQIRLAAGLLQKDIDVGFDLISITRIIDASGVDSSQVRVDLCPSPKVENGQVVCNVSVKPSDQLAPGDYQATVAITAPGQRLVQDRVFVKFERPRSGIEFNEQVISMGSLSDVHPILSYPISLRSVLWHGDPQIERYPTILELRDLALKETIQIEKVKFEFQKGDSISDLDYELILKADESLLPGRYEARLRFDSAFPDLVVTPSDVVVRFEKTFSVIELEFEESVVSFPKPVWGIPLFPKILPFAFNQTTYLHIPAIAESAPNAFDFPSPSVLQIKQGDQTTDSDAVGFTWRDDGQLPNTNQHDMALRLEILRTLGPGIWDIRLGVNAPTTSSSLKISPAEQVVRIRVLGWKEFFWCRFLPVGVISLLFLAVLGNHKSGRTQVLLVDGVRLEWDGKEPKQLSLDENGRFTLIPINGDPEAIIVRPKSKNEIGIDFGDGDEPYVLKRGASIDNIKYLE